jgi:exopolysaccharide biosynthesis polyprenyl glycosylphosphotransferase
MLKEKTTLVNAFITVGDVIIAIISFNIALYIEFDVFPVFTKDSVILQLLIIIFWGVLVNWFGLNTLYRSRPYSIVLFNCAGLSLVGTTLMAVGIMSFNLFYLGLRPLLFFAGIDFLLTFGFKIFLFKFSKTVRKKGYNYLNVLLIGDSTAASLLRLILTHPEWGYKITAVIGEEYLEKEFGSKFPFLAADTDVEQLLKDKTIDEVIHCKKVMHQKEIEELVEICSEMGVVYRMYSSFFNMLTNKTRLHYFGTTPLLTISNIPSNYLGLSIKSIFDFLFSLIVLIILLPFFLLIAIIIKLDSKGPVFFSQTRVGIHGRRFVVYKFRTMVANAEKMKQDLQEKNEMDGPVFKIARDPRITMVGRFLRKSSIDELPQFFNVLRGDMSVVGPRPPIPAEVKQYERWQHRRLSMKPGLTCIWQVSGRNSIPFEEWMKMDMEYIDNWSIKLDLLILIKTVRTVLRFDGE